MSKIRIYRISTNEYLLQDNTKKVAIYLTKKGVVFFNWYANHINEMLHNDEKCTFSTSNKYSSTDLFYTDAKRSGLEI